MDRIWPQSDTVNSGLRGQARQRRSQTVAGMETGSRKRFGCQPGKSVPLEAPGKEHHVLSSPRMDAVVVCHFRIHHDSVGMCFPRTDRWNFQPRLSHWRSSIRLAIVLNSVDQQIGIHSPNHQYLSSQYTRPHFVSRQATEIDFAGSESRDAFASLPPVSGSATRANPAIFTS